MTAYIRKCCVMRLNLNWNPGAYKCAMAQDTIHTVLFQHYYKYTL